jgi:predicted nuclease with TOPRIM domain
MREQIQARLEELNKELEAGQAELQKVEMQRTYLRETVLRIGGAVQVLEELLTDGPPAEADGAVGPGEDQLDISTKKKAAD